MTKTAAEVVRHPISIGALLIALTSGGGMLAVNPFLDNIWKPAKSYVREISIRMDVLIYLMCDGEDQCIEDAWKDVINKRMTSRMLSGRSH